MVETSLHELVLELTDRCPQRCLHCSSSSGPQLRTHLPEEVALRLIHEAAVLGAEQVNFGGGEPLCSPRFFAVLDRVLELGLRAEIFTSGVLGVGREVRPWPQTVVERLRGHDPLKIIFSVHDASPTGHDRITQAPGSFAAMLDSLDRSVAAGIRCQMNFVPLRPNAARLPEVAALCRKHGATRLSILRFVPQGRGLRHRELLELSEAEEEALVADILSIRGTCGVDIRTGSPFNGIVPGNGAPCRAGSGKLVIQADGNVLPCEVFKHSQTRDWGLSVHKQSLSEILESSTLTRLRQSIRVNDCLSCPVHSDLSTFRHSEAVGNVKEVPAPAVQV